MQASCKIHIPLPDFNDPSYYETVTAKSDVPVFSSYLLNAPMSTLNATN